MQSVDLSKRELDRYCRDSGIWLCEGPREFVENVVIEYEKSLDSADYGPDVGYIPDLRTGTNTDRWRPRMQAEREGRLLAIMTPRILRYIRTNNEEITPSRPPISAADVLLFLNALPITTARQAYVSPLMRELLVSSGLGRMLPIRIPIDAVELKYLFLYAPDEATHNNILYALRYFHNIDEHIALDDISDLAIDANMRSMLDTLQDFGWEPSTSALEWMDNHFDDS